MSEQIPDDLPRINIDIYAFGRCQVCGEPRGSMLWQDGDVIRLDFVCSVDCVCDCRTKP